MGVLLNDSRFLEMQNEKGGLSNMCEVLDRVEAKGLEKGKVIAYYDAGYSVEQIAEKVGISKEKVQEILAL